MKSRKRYDACWEALKMLHGVSSVKEMRQALRGVRPGDKTSDESSIDETRVDSDAN